MIIYCSLPNMKFKCVGTLCNFNNIKAIFVKTAGKILVLIQATGEIVSKRLRTTVLHTSETAFALNISKVGY